MFLTNHMLVIACVAEDPRASLVEIAQSVGLDPRSVVRLIEDLEAAGYLTRTRRGRRNAYDVAFGARVSDDMPGTVGELLALLGVTPSEGPKRRPP